MLDRIDKATAVEHRLNARIEDHIRPFQRQVDLLTTIRGASAHRPDYPGRDRRGPQPHSLGQPPRLLDRGVAGQLRVREQELPANHKRIARIMRQVGLTGLCLHRRHRIAGAVGRGESGSLGQADLPPRDQGPIVQTAAAGRRNPPQLPRVRRR